jgi:hypothetical protein
MNDIGRFIDGRGLLTRSPFKSWLFVNSSVACLGSILLTAYIIVRHWHILNGNLGSCLAIFVGIHSFYQWVRVRRYYRRMQELYEAAVYEQPRDGSSLDIALRTAAGAIIDIVFYHFGMVLVCLFVIDGLLFRLDGLK